jgi:hypothetical protein
VERLSKVFLSDGWILAPERAQAKGTPVGLETRP